MKARCEAITCTSDFVSNRPHSVQCDRDGRYTFRKRRLCWVHKHAAKHGPRARGEARPVKLVAELDP